MNDTARSSPSKRDRYSQAARVREITERKRQVEQALRRQGLPLEGLEARKKSLGRLLRAALNGQMGVAESLRPRKLPSTLVTAEVERLRSVGITAWGADTSSSRHPERALSILRLLASLLVDEDLDSKDPAWDKAAAEGKAELRQRLTDSES
jgi:hypothetical protein